MAIKIIDISNVMVFKGDDFPKIVAKDADGQVTKTIMSPAFHIDFCDGINVILGENGIGKTTILKMIYAATQWSIKTTDPRKTKKFLDFFSYNLINSDVLKNASNKEKNCFYSISDGKHVFKDSLSDEGFYDFDKWLGLDIPSVFIPTTEMLSHAKGFLAMNQKYSMPFDGTQIDIIVNASLPETREVTASCQAILDKISQAIDGIVVQEDDTFYVLKNDGRKVDFSLEAEGLRKLGLLWKLVRNGLLEKGTILLWDEPEANINPRYIPLLAELLLTLEKEGVQIFVATHDYFLAKYIEVKRKKENSVQYISLYKAANDIVKCECADQFELLEHNAIMETFRQLYREEIGVALK